MGGVFGAVPKFQKFERNSFRYSRQRIQNDQDWAWGAVALVGVVTNRTWGLEAPGPELSPDLFAQDDGFLFSFFDVDDFLKVSVTILLLVYVLVFWS